MDYVPAHQTYYPAGIVYNAEQKLGRKIGGVRYHKVDKSQYQRYVEKLETVLEMEPVIHGQPQKYEIKINASKNPKPKKAEFSNYKIGEYQEPKTATAPKIQKAHVEPKAHQIKVDYDPDKYVRAAFEGKFLVKIQKQTVDFAKEGIKPAELSYTDREWLRKAAYYFVNAKEGGKKIGSAAAYTSPEILHALWSTAKEKGIDPKRFLVQIFNETRFNPNLTGKAGEKGLGQFKHSTAKSLGYSWSKMKGGIATYAYQAKCSAEYVAKVGEQTYNGRGYKAKRYVTRIDKHLKRIEKLDLPETIAKI